ncbi:MAG: hypothetical protein ACK6DC_20535 [Planctomycetota bacterium]
MFDDRLPLAPKTLRSAMRSVAWMMVCCVGLSLSGCTLFPDIRHKPQYHNPFPQLTRIAILPFRNQSQEPTLKGSRVTSAYYAELQSIPGFEILPVGVVENQWLAFETNILRRPAATSEDFQRFAQYLGVDAVLQGAITDYTPYYPPRIALNVNWYAANPGFHPIPAGYGLPWGTKNDKKIPQWVRLEAERSLAREQLKTQSPELRDSMENEVDQTDEDQDDEPIEMTAFLGSQDSADRTPGEPIPFPLPAPSSQEASSKTSNQTGNEEVPAQRSDEETPFSDLPADWPDPEGFIPHAPRSQRPPLIAQYEPVISYMKAYNGSDEDFTESLEEYFYFRDDVRFGGWQAYLQRSEDFIRFCCHRHVVETLAARGGQLESRLILRWPIGRYER